MRDTSQSGASKLLSICMFGRDDDYMPDFKYRITTTINYIARSLEILGRLGDVEIVVTDWASDVPMAQSLMFSPAAGRICRFVYVPPALAAEVNKKSTGIHVALALNAALRRAQGEFLLVSGADTLASQHALQTLLNVLDGTQALPVRVEATLMLLPRYQVPWQFVQRQPGLEEWEHYLFLNTGELNYEKDDTLGVCSGAGGLVMHKELWQRTRGIDEKYGGWGFNDIDLGLRISQVCPWVALSSVGINLYHMEHPPVDRRVSAVRNENPRDYNRQIEVNRENWGLGAHNLEEQRVNVSSAARQSSAEGMQERQIDGPESPDSQEAMLAQLKSKRIGDHVCYCLGAFPRDYVRYLEVEALCFLAWHSLTRFPRTYLEFGFGKGCAAAVVAGANPAVEVYGFDDWEGVISDRTDVVEICGMLRHSFGHFAYQRFMNGDIQTAVERLRKSFVGNFVVDLAFVRGNTLGKSLGTQVEDLLGNLAPGGALVVTMEPPGILEALWPEWHKQHPHCSLFVSNSRNTGMILAGTAGPLTASASSPIRCEFDTRPLLRRLGFGRLARVDRALSLIRRAFRGLCQPLRYWEFVTMVVRHVRCKYS